MCKIKIVSFDLEGTLTTPDFSLAVWYEGIPSLYAEQNNIPFGEAQAIVKNRYRELGDRRLEWYDIKYWFNLFNIQGYEKILKKYSSKVAQYPDVIPALSVLEKEYKLIISTNSSREFIPYLLKGIETHFYAVFSSVSDYKLIKCPEFYEKLTQALSIQAQEITHVGDSREFDLIACEAAGLKGIHLNRSQKSDSVDSISNLMDLKGRLFGI